MRTKQQLTFLKLEHERYNNVHDKLRRSLIEVNPGKLILPERYQKIAQDILDMEVNESDVWTCSYPRTGSTWCAEMVWLIGHDLDFDTAKSTRHMVRCPYLERSCFALPADSQSDFGSVDIVKYHLPHPRYMRSHLPWDLLPLDIEREDGSVKAKVIYTARQPKDVVVSYYNYFKLIHRTEFTFEYFCGLFLEDRLPFTPIWNHIFGFWNRRHDPNVLFIKYEDMKRDLPSIVRKIAKFLDKPLTEEQVDKLCHYLSFNNMQSNRSVNWEPILEETYGKSHSDQTDLKFVRKGEVGDWKNFMSDDMSKRFDNWIQKNLEGSDLNFD